jgi:hypothetical protein
MVHDVTSSKILADFGEFNRSFNETVQLKFQKNEIKNKNTLTLARLKV